MCQVRFSASSFLPLSPPPTCRCAVETSPPLPQTKKPDKIQQMARDLCKAEGGQISQSAGDLTDALCSPEQAMHLVRSSPSILCRSTVEEKPRFHFTALFSLYRGCFVVSVYFVLRAV